MAVLCVADESRVLI